MTVIVVTGGRNYSNRQFVWGVMDTLKFKYKNIRIRVGDAYGVDAFVRGWAAHNNIPFEVYRADWKQFGKAAGPIRNRKMIAGADILYAFPGGKGTKDCTNAAESAGLFVVEVSDEHRAVEHRRP